MVNPDRFDPLKAGIARALRAEMIAAGDLTPRRYLQDPPRTWVDRGRPHTVRRIADRAVLRLDAAGRAAAARHMRLPSGPGVFFEGP